MIKIVALSAAVAIGAVSIAPTVATARVVVVKKKRAIAANGRCRGVSYGTGARRCGTLSGGPAGGNSSRN